MHATMTSMRRLAVVFALALMMAAALTPGATAQPGANDGPGNSGAARQCRQGGWETLARAESPTVAFANQDGCVSYAAQGGTLVERVVNRTVTLTWAADPENAQYCSPVVSLTGFAPGTYSYSLSTSSSVMWPSPIEVGSDGTGESRPRIPFNEGVRVVAEVDGVMSAVSAASCPP